MDKQAILNLLTQPTGNEAMFSEIVQSYLKNIKCSKNYAVVGSVTVPPAPKTDDDAGSVIRIHTQLYTEVMEVLVDKFNHYSDEKIFPSETHIEEFVATLVPFLHKFYAIHQGSDPQTDEKYPIQQLEIFYKKDDDNEVRYIELVCTVVQHSVGLYDVVRQMGMKFFQQN